MSTERRPQHAAPADAPPPLPEPPFAERVRTLLHVGRTGTLATQSNHAPGFPFASVMPYALDVAGRPVFLVSTMAMHTQNLQRDGHASLLVTQPGWTEDPLAGARVSLIGEVVPIAETDRPAARDAYLGRHENARYWVDFEDFGFWRMAIADIYYVAGFGAMGWVPEAEYGVADPDPLVDVESDIVAHMNADHAEALALICRHQASVPADEATMTSIDRMGFRVRVRHGDDYRAVRINFSEDVRSKDEARRALVTMVRAARDA